MERLARIHQELDGAGVLVSDGLGKRDGGSGDSVAQPGGERGRGRDFEDLLVAALETAIALAQVDDRAVRIAENLHLDVAGASDELLRVEPAVAERGPRFGLGARERLLDVGGSLDDPQATAAAARHRLKQHGGAGSEACHERRGILDVRHRFAAKDRQAGRRRRRTRAHLVAHHPQRFDRGAHEDNPGLLAGLRERRVLAQEPVSRVQRVAARCFRRGDHAGDVQVRGRAFAGQRDRLVGKAHVRREGVIRRIDGDRADAHFMRSPDHPDGDFAAVRHQQFRKHPARPPMEKRLEETERSREA